MSTNRQILILDQHDDVLGYFAGVLPKQTFDFVQLTTPR